MEKSRSGMVDHEFEKKLRAVRRRRVLAQRDPLLFLEIRVCEGVGNMLALCTPLIDHFSSVDLHNLMHLKGD